MHKPPVFYALIQVKFNPVQMERFVPEFREALRKGYPDYDREEQVELRFSKNPSASRSPEPHPRSLWHFLDMTRTEGFTLLDDALVYHTNCYDCFSHCRNEALTALRLLHELAGLAYVDRVGMRYLNAITSIDDGPLSALVKPALLGLHAELQGNLEHSFSETSKIVEGGRLVLRALVNERGLAIPPDLHNQTLNLSEDLMSYQGPIVMMDTDYFVESRYAFDLDVIEKQFEMSHSILIDTFKAAVTEKAKSLWHL